MLGSSTKDLGRVGLRSARPDDLPYLYSLHTATMKEYVDQIWGWDEAFQENRFREGFVPKKTRIITLDGRDVGMLATEERDTDVFLKLIEIDAAHQRQGIGTTIIRGVIAQAAQKKKPVFLHVLKVNPARALYERLGFSVVAETPTHIHMRTTSPRSGGRRD